MSRFLACGNVRRGARSLLPVQKTGYLEVASSRAYYTVEAPYTLCRLFPWYKNCLRGQSPFMLQKAKDKLLQSSGSRNLYSLSSRRRVSHHAQFAWKKLSQLCSYRGPVLPPIGQIARAVSLALTRSNLVAPGVIAFIVGEFARTQRTLAEAEGLPTKDTLFLHAQDGHVYLTLILFSLLECIILFIRAIYLAVLFSPCIAMAPFAKSLGIQFRKIWLRVLHLTLEKAGPAFIKWGQWAAARPDLFPRDLCSELAKLHTQAPAHSFNFTQKSIEKAFGRKLPEIFEKFDMEPVASGSVAQVHQAILKYKYPGQQIKPMVVAVKVRHPGVGEAIRRDFVIISCIAKISRFIPYLKSLRLDESIQQFAIYMMSQVDLSREAAHLNRFIYNFRRWKDVSFPRPLYPLVHPSVLVETYERGESVMHYIDELEGNEPIKNALAHIGTHALLKMLLVDNFIHADMHPGNILVRVYRCKSPSKQLFRLRPHVVFLDVGMTAELSKRDQLNLVEFFKAVALRDGRTVAECTLRLSGQQDCPNPRAFIEELERSFKIWYSPDGDIIHAADCMHQLLEKVQRHKVRIDGSVCTVMVTTLVLEGWQRKLDPGYDVMQTLQTLLFKADWAESLSYTIEGLMAP
ncbi:PREDICTED: ABC1 family protein YPL109C, mitochondrial-like [Prunus mume]|uniref:ABC1 family protein YPL109C, mitochondrial-like n=1 Tax=Prunus mume TaxID=102107 RepID=A0ABM0NLW3_PRUMU|nr:PREDICTED: ABC1 family protein YPL109C, mitochondrial-like [Prunus mume]